MKPIEIATDIVIDLETKRQLQADYQEESQVIVHGTIHAGLGHSIRLWKTIFLFDADSDHKSKLIYADNISFHPVWTRLRPYDTHSFTMVFSGLPKACKRFHLIEVIPEPGEFKVMNITRNHEDVYRIVI